MCGNHTELFNVNKKHVILPCEPPGVFMCAWGSR
jgi:hypothetical protein